jgi:hypothetical protein
MGNPKLPEPPSVFAFAHTSSPYLNLTVQIRGRCLQPSSAFSPPRGSFQGGGFEEALFTGCRGSAFGVPLAGADEARIAVWAVAEPVAVGDFL